MTLPKHNQLNELETSNTESDGKPSAITRSKFIRDDDGNVLEDTINEAKRDIAALESEGPEVGAGDISVITGRPSYAITGIAPNLYLDRDIAVSNIHYRHGITQEAIDEQNWTPQNYPPRNFFKPDNSFYAMGLYESNELADGNWVEVQFDSTVIDGVNYFGFSQGFAVGNPTPNFGEVITNVRGDGVLELTGHTNGNRTDYRLWIDEHIIYDTEIDRFDREWIANGGNLDGNVRPTTGHISGSLSTIQNYNPAATGVQVSLKVWFKNKDGTSATSTGVDFLHTAATKIVGGKRYRLYQSLSNASDFLTGYFNSGQTTLIRAFLDVDNNYNIFDGCAPYRGVNILTPSNNSLYAQIAILKSNQQKIQQQLNDFMESIAHGVTEYFSSVPDPSDAANADTIVLTQVGTSVSPSGITYQAGTYEKTTGDTNRANLTMESHVQTPDSANEYSYRGLINFPGIVRNVTQGRASHNPSNAFYALYSVHDGIGHYDEVLITPETLYRRMMGDATNRDLWINLIRADGTTRVWRQFAVTSTTMTIQGVMCRLLQSAVADVGPWNTLATSGETFKGGLSLSGSFNAALLDIMWRPGITQAYTKRR